MSSDGARSVPVVRSVMRAFDILEQLTDGPRGVLEISKEIGLPKTTVYRILTTLEQCNVVYRAPDSQEYQLGAYLVYLGHCVGSARMLQEAAIGPMRELRDRHEETVNLNIVVNNERVCIASVESRKSLRSASVVGERSPLHSGAAARSILAFFPDERVEEYFKTMSDGGGAKPGGANVQQIWADIDRARRDGYVTSRGERTLGVTSIGVPIWDSSGTVVGSVNLSGPSDRVESKDMNELAQAVLQTGREISLALGFSGSPGAYPGMRHVGG